jgi:YidC/Oxa1 family membrane protein insertase
MDTQKRVFLAVLLMGAALMLTNLLFPPAPPPAPRKEVERPAAAAAAPAPVLASPAAEVPARTVTVSSPLYRYTFSTRGASLTGAELLRYPALTDREEPVQLIPPGVGDFLAHRVAVGGDTLDLGTLPFRVSGSALDLREGGRPQELRFTYAAGGVGVEVVYTFRPDHYLVDVRGRVTGVPGGATLLTALGPGLATRDAPQDVEVVAMQGEEIERFPFQEVEGVERLDGPLAWVGVKDKYFLAALVQGEGPAFGGMVARRLPPAREGEGTGEDARTVLRPRVATEAAYPLQAGGAFSYRAYLGPQEHERMAAVGHDLQEVTPYGYAWLRPVVRPIASAALWVLSYLHDTLGVSYGWALILFGIMVRLVMWPLNAKAMRAQMKNMAVQPLMQEIQTRYKNDPQRQQQEMIRLYKEHGFNPLAGCLPLLLPMPVFITLFFVFQNAIAFRGTEFWWMPDLSLKDPYYIVPLLFVATTFLSQWVSTKLSGMETNPQMKMMMYLMPVMMGIFFFTFASGLNLYYTASNLAGLPQQILIARERRRATEELKAKQDPPAKRPAGPKGPHRPQRKR